ncbi:MAG: hypothetical protein LBK05_01255 [Treponema sp.]|nr:hypothetical protein [Treponema sp.]
MSILPPSFPVNAPLKRRMVPRRSPVPGIIRRFYRKVEKVEEGKEVE